ncbi:MAG: hypothetical protein L0K86_01100 [Actinomycetia bacterium]|nr:hypothetical protein [Actinomycetes bacterium]
MSRNHEAGQAATRQRIEFVASSDAAATLLAVRSTIAAPEEPPPLITDLYLAEASDHFLRYVIGSMATTTATAVVVVSPESDGPCRGEYRVLSWTEVDELGGRLSRLERLATGVRVAVRGLDAAADIRVTVSTF